MLVVNGTLLLLLAVTLVATLLIGAVPIGIHDALVALSQSSPATDIILRARLPRVLLAVTANLFNQNGLR